MHPKHFRSLSKLTQLVNAYFSSVGMETDVHKVRKIKSRRGPAPITTEHVAKRPKTKPADNKYLQPALTDLALYLGFNSLDEFKHYENEGKYASHLKRARLLITAVYEKKLIQPSPSGAIFALKTMGWNEKPDDKPTVKMPTTLNILMVESGPALAANEKEIVDVEISG